MCELLEGVLRDAGWLVEIVGPDGDPSRWAYRVGAGPIASSRSANRKVRALRPRLVITNGMLGVGVPRSTAHIHIYHGTMVGNTLAEGSQLPWRERWRRGVGAGLSEALSARNATVVCVAEGAAREVRRFYRANVDAVIPNGIDTSTFQPSARHEARRRLGLDEGGRYCLFVGRMQYLKGSDLLLPAAQRAGYQLLVAGSGEREGAISLGTLSPQELAVAYAAADCVLFPSRYEACSYVVLEAIACGTPLVASRVGWMPTLLDAVPEYGSLCIELDVEDIAEHLRRLPQTATAPVLGRARDWVLEHNSLESYAQQWRGLLASLSLAPR
jgi:glycosyltransferase involved in cell wall biosynthesis